MHLVLPGRRRLEVTADIGAGRCGTVIGLRQSTVKSKADIGWIKNIYVRLHHAGALPVTRGRMAGEAGSEPVGGRDGGREVAGVEAAAVGVVFELRAYELIGGAGVQNGLWQRGIAVAEIAGKIP